MQFPRCAILRGAFLSLVVLGVSGCGRSDIRVASKQFTESVILGEIVTLMAETTGAEVTHVRMLGDTSKTWNGLLTNQLDVYCDYTGTILKETLADKDIGGEEELRRYLKEHYDVIMSKPLGFSNNYALGMRRKHAEQLGITTISDLRDHPDLRLGLSAPFLERSDGWAGLKAHYHLPFARPEGMQHEVAYTAIASGAKDVIDVYTTEAKIRLHDLVILEDDQEFFPAYDAVILYRADLAERAPEVVEALHRLEGTLPAERIMELNYEATVEKKPETEVARDFLNEQFNLNIQVEAEKLWERILHQTWNHLKLVGISLFFAILTAIPLGIVAAQWPRAGQVILGGVGIVQTLPSFAMLTFLLVLLSMLQLPALGLWCAVVALYVYSLLPIVRNTHTGLVTIPLQIRESADALGLSPWAQLYLVELPMASRSILAGIKTAAVINVGFATLGGLIGAGGYGQLIFAGLIKDDHYLLMAGAIPSMILALAIQGLFELAERFLVPRGLRLRTAE